jgi:SAM-dependent methyltransferase
MTSLPHGESKDQFGLKEFINGLPIVRRLKRAGIKKFFQPFPGSERYWSQRYDSGGNSGPGSYNHLAEFKAEILNKFVKENSIPTVMEFGCGDGNQLKLADYPHYLGFDISSAAIDICKQAFAEDERKRFKTVKEYDGETAQLTLSLDVIYHLIEDDVFHAYMERLFNSSERFVIVYSSDTDSNPPGQAPHVRHRKFTKWVEMNKPNWKLIEYIPNRYPLKNDQHRESFADFYVFEKSLS